MEKKIGPEDFAVWFEPWLRENCHDLEMTWYQIALAAWEAAIAGRMTHSAGEVM